MSTDIVAIAMLQNQRIICVRQGILEIALTDNSGQSYINLVIDDGDYLYDNNGLLCCDNGTVFLATRGKSKIYRSSDNGATWNIVENGIMMNDGYRAIFKSNDVIFALSESGSIFSKNNGDTWDFLRNPFSNLEAVKWLG